MQSPLPILYSCCILLVCSALVAWPPYVQAYKSGVQYTYQYESTVVLSELQQQPSDAKHSARLVLRANLSLSRLQFANGLSALRLRFLDVSVSNGRSTEVAETPAAAHDQKLQPPMFEFLLVALEPSNPAWIGSVIVPEGEDPFWLNLARGVASLYRYRDPNVGNTREADAMGECGVSFAWLDGSQQRRLLEKRMDACENVELDGERNSANPLLAVKRSGNATTLFEFTNVDAEPPASVLTREAHELLPKLPRGFGLRASAESILRLLETSAAEPTTATATAEFDTLSAYLQSSGRPTREVALPTAKELERPDATNSLTQFLATRLPSYKRDIANPSMRAMAVLQGLPLARGAKDQMELRRQLELNDNRPHLPDIMELYSACGTKQCYGALFDFVAKHLTDLSDPLLERLLLALSQSSRAGRPLLERTRDLLLRLEAAGRTAAARAAYQALATLGRKFGDSGAGTYGGGLESVPDLLLVRLAACDSVTDAAEADDCRTAILSAMTNCPSAKYRRPLIQSLLANSTAGSQTTVARIRALQVSGPLDPAERQHLADLLKQRHVPLSDPIRYAIATALGGPAACAEAGIDCRSLRRSADLWLPLRRRHRFPAAVGHEELLAGLTSSGFHRGRVFSTGGIGSDGKVEFELDMLGNRLGGIRRSDFRLAFAPLAESAAQSDILGVRLFADAVDSLMDGGAGGGSGGGIGSDMTEEATAGLQLGVLGEWLRPQRFFTGSSGLMSAVWNAPEEPVSVLQGGFLLHDFATRVHMHNGLVVQTTLNGALSLNISGSLSVSIWNRDAASKVLNSIGVALQAQAGIRTGRFSVDFASQVQAELLNTFATFVSFAETPVRTCLAMSNSPVAVTHNCHVTDSLGPRYDHHNHDFYLSGLSFSLGGRNDRLCSELVPDSDE